MSAKRRLFCLVPLTITILSLASPAVSRGAVPPPPAITVPAPGLAATYRIEPDDVLEITVLGEPELSRSLTVLPDGQVSYPYLGQVRVEGLTVSELTEKIRAALLRQLRNPEVTASITKRADHSVSVLGAVKTPGRSVIQSGWRVLDVLAAAGGLAVERPEWATATLVSGAQTQEIDLTTLLSAGTPAMNPPVAPGDILLVAERAASRTQVQVLGAVAKQGTYAAPSDGSLVSLIAAAGGAAPDAALSRAVIRRSGANLPVDLRPLLSANGAPAPATAAGAAVRLEPGDTLFIPQNTRRFAVLGAVARPGALRYPEEGAVGVIEALSLVGGQLPNADLKNVLLMRADSIGPDGKGTAGKAVSLNLWDEIRRRRTGKPSANGDLSVASIALAPGDVLYIPDKGASHGAAMLSALPMLGLLLR